MEKYHVLFTGVGRRVELIQAFRQAASNLHIELKIYGADMAGDAPALAFCDYIRKVCGMHDSAYISQLLELCKKDCIDLLIPTIDTDLLVLSQNTEKFDAIGTKVLISEPDKIMLCRDKNLTANFFEMCGLKAPRTYNDYHKYAGPYPCFIKPKDGSSSINAFKVNDYKQLVVYAEKIVDYVIQPFIGGKEYTVDIFCDFDGNPVTIVPRERVAVRSGEVLKTKIDLDKTMIQEARQLISKFKPCGPLTVQLIRQEGTGEDYYIEINPRYGGGAPLSMKAGARTAEVILKLLKGESVSYQESGIADNAVYSRYDQSVCIHEGRENQKLRGVIFDLDDTLYSEKQYIRNGYGKVADFLGDKTVAGKLWKFFEEGRLAIDALLEERGEEEKKAACLELYRKQMPEITLYSGVADIIEDFKRKGIKIGIITDGRVEGQRKKIEALGLDKMVDDIIITDELGGPQFRKPNDIAFRIMQCRWQIPFEQIVYIGDNPSKDFQASMQLGMKSIWFRNTQSLYYTESMPLNIQTIDEWNELLLVIK
ncbi:MAG: HAD-IA family hydrolase [Clostridiales bacterium]|nr:HAD-IA family hydrolase [Clostridiales bacterium]MDY4112622.1 HAD-IA family hydrolase [Roseburia sp.]